MFLSNSNYQFIISHLKAFSINFSTKWVDETIKHCKSLKPDITAVELKDAVYKEWLLTNLRDMRVATLPNDIMSYKNITLNGIYAVQVESMLDCSKSSYSQLLQLQNAENKSKNIDDSKKTDEETKIKRCLIFVLCDGVQEIKAMEYEYISSFKLLNSDFVPGFKILIKGPVLFRKGMLLLKQENVKILGGKVDLLCEANGLKSILLKNLRIDEYSDESCSNTALSNNNSDSVSRCIQEKSFTVSSTSNNSNSEKYTGMDDTLSEDIDVLMDIPLEESVLFKNNKDLLEDGEDCFRKQKRVRVMKSTTNVDEERNESELFNDDLFPVCLIDGNKGGDNIFINVEVPGDTSFLNHNHTSLQNSNFKMNASDKSTHYFDSQNKEFDGIKFGSFTSGDNDFTDKTTVKDTQLTIDSEFQASELPSGSKLKTERKLLNKTISSHPFVYLKQISVLSLSSPVNFIVKAIIVTLKSKISIKNDEFVLQANITDGSFTIQVNFSSNVLEKILEFSPCEIIAMMKEKSMNLAINERLKNIFHSAQQKLLSMNCLMEVTFFNDGSMPCVVNLEEVQLSHLNALKARMLQ